MRPFSHNEILYLLTTVSDSEARGLDEIATKHRMMGRLIEVLTAPPADNKEKEEKR